MSPLIQMLVSSRNTLTDTPIKNVQPNIWTSCDLIKSTYKINHYSWGVSDSISMMLGKEQKGKLGMRGYHNDNYI